MGKVQAWILVLAAAGFAGLNRTQAAAPARRPNILFILTDDQRWNALGCMGDPNIRKK